jgi:single-stranded DNA-binding protein
LNAQNSSAPAARVRSGIGHELKAKEIQEMNLHKNEVHLAGVLSQAPAVHVTSTATKVATLNVATTVNKKFSEYHRVVCWEELAGKAERLDKGDFVKVVGRLQTRSYEDKTQTKRYVTEVVAFQLVCPAKDAVTVSTCGTEVTDEDIPF